MKPETRKQLVRWAAGAHLVIALIYSTHLAVEHFIPTALERLLRVYGSYTGAYAHFDFFAPSVVSQVRVQFRLGKGDEIIRTFEVVSPSSEVNQRLATMFNYYLRPTVRPLLVNSWARYALAKNPDAQWVQTRIEFLEIPTLAQLKEGRKAAWVEVGRFAAMREGAPVR